MLTNLLPASKRQKTAWKLPSQRAALLLPPQARSTPMTGWK